MKPSQLNKLDISRIRYHKWMYQQFIDITSQCVINYYLHWSLLKVYSLWYCIVAVTSFQCWIDKLRNYHDDVANFFWLHAFLLLACFAFTSRCKKLQSTLWIVGLDTMEPLHTDGRTVERYYAVLSDKPYYSYIGRVFKSM